MRASPRLWWWVLALLVGTLLADLVARPEHLAIFGVQHYGVWFLDTKAILAASDAAAAGHDVYRYNPLDPLGRPHVYPHGWLLLGRLGLTRADTALVGFLLGAAFFVVALAGWRPRSWREVAWALVLIGSPPVLLALDRGNNDLAIFVLLAAVAPCLEARREGWGFVAIGLVALAAWLKVYPAVAAAVVLAGAGTREARWRLVATAAAFALVAVDAVPDLRRYGGLVPSESGLMTFGAANLFTYAGADARVGTYLALALGAALAAWLWRWNFTAEWRIGAAQRGAWWRFVLGAAVLTGCFFAGRSYAYRWVFALWLGPLVWAVLNDDAAPRRVRRLAVATGGLLVVALWLDGLASAWLGSRLSVLGREPALRWAERIFFAEQPLTWALFACLLVFLVKFARETLAVLRGIKAPD